MNWRLYLFLAAGAVITGCVSKSAYKALEADHARVRNDSSLLERRIRQLNEDNMRLATESAHMEQSLNNSLEEKQDSLNYKEQLLRERELSLKDMKARKEEEREAFSTLGARVFSQFTDYDPQTLSTTSGCTNLVIAVNEKRLFAAGSSKTELLANDIHNRLRYILDKYPDLNLVITGYADSSATGRDKNPDPMGSAYMKTMVLYKDLVLSQPKSLKSRISVSVKGEPAMKQYPLQVDYLLFSNLIPCIHTK